MLAVQSRVPMTAFSNEGVFDRQRGWEDGQIALAMARKSVADETEVLRECGAN